MIEYKQTAVEITEYMKTIEELGMDDWELRAMNRVLIAPKEDSEPKDVVQGMEMIFSRKKV